ncbi:hypothetical protein A6R68_15703 [Neotoma lepida]|uniref:Uncharacterized protein n=1 Tax=Neotoma lepida TaxID=56216 RepID=A0A1A6H828_NEOLE|nr:hypothetical protein A6R68_15703 [Neotoma lepida]
MALLIGDGLWSVVIFTAIFLLLMDLMYRRKFWTARYPPGPVPLPGLGNLLQVDFQNMPYSLYKLQQRYGDVFSLQMAWKPVVVVNGLKAVREVLRFSFLVPAGQPRPSDRGIYALPVTTVPYELCAVMR